MLNGWLRNYSWWSQKTGTGSLKRLCNRMAVRGCSIFITAARSSLSNKWWKCTCIQITSGFRGYIFDGDVPHGFWDDSDNHGQYAAWLAAELQMVEREDWYQLTQKMVHQNNGGRLLNNRYNGSPQQFVEQVVKVHLHLDHEWGARSWIYAKIGHWLKIGSFACTIDADYSMETTFFLLKSPPLLKFLC